MNKKEFDLSKKTFLEEESITVHDSKGYHVIKVSDVKEFIKKRDALDRLLMLKQITRQEHADKCDKLAGEELTK